MAMLALGRAPSPMFKVGDRVVLCCRGKAECGGSGTVSSVRPYGGPWSIGVYEYDLDDGRWRDGTSSHWSGIREEWLARELPDGWRISDFGGITDGQMRVFWDRDSDEDLWELRANDNGKRRPVPPEANEWMEADFSERSLIKSEWVDWLKRPAP